MTPNREAGTGTAGAAIGTDDPDATGTGADVGIGTTPVIGDAAADRDSMRTVVSMVPGIEGGVDEAAGYLLGDGPLSDRWRAETIATRRMRPAASPLFLVLAAAKLVIRRLRGDVDVVHLNMSSRASTARKMVLAAVARVIGLPYVIQLHSGGFEDFYTGLPGWAKGLTRRLFADAAHVFVLGEVFRTLLIDRVGADPGRISVLRNAVPVPAPRSAPRPSGHPSDAASLPDAADAPVGTGGSDQPRPLETVRLIFTGRIWARKGIWDLLDALAELRDLPWTLVVLGDGEVDGARERVTAMGLDDRIEVLSWQPRAEVDRLVLESDVFCVPSHLEALSVSLLEAMAAGLCCISTPVGAHREILVDGENALVTTPSDVDGLTDALRRAISDPELRARIGAGGRQTVIEQCSVEVTRGRLLAAYETFLPGR